MFNNKQVNILPTYTDLPRTLKSTYAIPRIYLRYLERYLNEIRKHNRLIFSPKLPYSNNQEYILTYADNKLIYLERSLDVVNAYEIEFNKIMMIKLSEDLLDAKYSIYYMYEDIFKVLEISFNKTAYQLYEDIFDIILNAKNKALDSHLSDLKQSNPVLYNYAHKALKLGKIESYRYLDLYYVVDKTILNTEVLIIHLDKHDVLITKQGTKIDTWYMLNDKVVLDLVNDYGLNNLVIHIFGKEVLNIKGIKN